MIGLAVSTNFLVGVAVGVAGVWAWNRWVKNIPSKKA